MFLKLGFHAWIADGATSPSCEILTTWLIAWLIIAPKLLMLFTKL
jgi:hypothetical protein